MEKNEHILFQDIPCGRKDGMFHSAILTTYAIDLVHFDTYIRNVLHRKQISSINILIDSAQLDKALQYVSPTYLYNAGTDYCISNICAQGVFHPKINFFVGDDSVLVLVGSGNLTVTGHGKNHEAFSGFMISAEDETQRPLIEECWSYLKRFASHIGTFEKQRILHEIPANCSFLNDEYSFKPHSYSVINDKLQAALLYNEKGDSIFSQISRLVSVDDVDKITVLSPFFDDNGTALENLLQLCPHANMDVLIQQDCTLPPYKMRDSKRIVFFDFDETKRGKVRIKDYDRVAHAKVMVFHTDKMEYCVIGSANATVAGLGTKNKRGINEEFGILYASSSINFLYHLGLKPAKRHVIDHTVMESTKNSMPSEFNKVLRLVSANIENGYLTIVVSDGLVLPKSFSIIVVDRKGKYILTNYRINNNIIHTDFNVGKKADVGICYIESTKGVALSNTILINNIEELETTNPSPTIRMINRFVSKIESDGYNGLEVVDMLTDVMSNAANNDTEDYDNIKISSTGLQKAKCEVLPSIAYNSEYDNDEVVSSRSSSKYNTSRLIACIEESIRLALRRQDDEYKEEEEEANSETSHERVDNERHFELTKSDIDKLVEQAASVLIVYKNLLRRKFYLYNNGKKTMSKDDLDFFSLSFFAAMEISYFKRFTYDFDTTNKTEKSYSQKKLYDGLDRIMEREGIGVFAEFCQFCKQYGTEAKNKKEFASAISRVMKYALVFLTSIHRQNKPYCWNKVAKSMKELIMVFGIPQKEETCTALLPLMKRYDYAFNFSDIERAVRQMGIEW